MPHLISRTDPRHVKYPMAPGLTDPYVALLISVCLVVIGCLVQDQPGLGSNLGHLKSILHNAICCCLACLYELSLVQEVCVWLACKSDMVTLAFVEAKLPPTSLHEFLNKHSPRPPTLCSLCMLEAAVRWVPRNAGRTPPFAYSLSLAKDLFRNPNK